MLHDLSSQPSPYSSTKHAQILCSLDSKSGCLFDSQQQLFQQDFWRWVRWQVQSVEAGVGPVKSNLLCAFMFSYERRHRLPWKARRFSPFFDAKFPRAHRPSQCWEAFVRDGRGPCHKLEQPKASLIVKLAYCRPKPYDDRVRVMVARSAN